MPCVKEKILHFSTSWCKLQPFLFLCFVLFFQQETLVPLFQCMCHVPWAVLLHRSLFPTFLWSSMYCSSCEFSQIHTVLHNKSIIGCGKQVFPQQDIYFYLEVHLWTVGLLKPGLGAVVLLHSVGFTIVSQSQRVTSRKRLEIREIPKW